MKAVAAVLSMALGIAIACSAHAQGVPEIPSNPTPHTCLPVVEDPAPVPVVVDPQPAPVLGSVAVVLSQNPLFRPFAAWLSAWGPGYDGWNRPRPSALHPRRRR